MSLPEVVASPRLELPLWRAADVRAIRDGGRRPGWHPDFPRPDDRDAATLWHQGDPWGPRSIVRGVTTLGSVGFFGPPQPADDEVREAELGFGLVREAWGWGFATEAARAMLTVAEAEGVRVRAATAPENTAALKVLAKCGFTGLRGSDEDGRLVMVRPTAPPHA